MAGPPLRIVHVITSLGRGGAEAHLTGLIRRQAELGHQVTCVQLRGPDDWGQQVRDAGAEVADLQMRRYGDLRALGRLRARLAGTRPDVVHAHLQPAEIHAALARKAAPEAAYVVSRHNLDPFHRGPLPVVMEAWSTRRADEVIGISHAVAARVLRHAPGYPEARVTAIPYGIDLSPYPGNAGTIRREKRAELGLSPDAQVVGLVSRLIATKRADVLVEVLARLRAGRPNLVLVVAGDGPEMAGVKALARTRGVAEAVKLLGARRDVPALMQAFDLFAFPSVSEGFGLVLLEAMAARTPVVATGIAPMTDLVEDEVTGLTAPAGDVDAFAAAVERLLDDPDLARRLGEAGRLQAEAHSIERMAERTEEVYRRALARRRAG